MLFTHDTEVALAAAAALVNTMPGSVPGDRDPDRLTSLDELATLYRDQGWTGRFDRDAAELEAVRALRPRLRGFWELDEAAVVDLVNELLAEARAVPQLVDHDGVGWHVHATPADAPLPDGWPSRRRSRSSTSCGLASSTGSACARRPTATTSWSTSRATARVASVRAGRGAGPHRRLPRPPVRPRLRPPHERRAYAVGPSPWHTPSP